MFRKYHGAWGNRKVWAQAVSHPNTWGRKLRALLDKDSYCIQCQLMRQLKWPGFGKAWQWSALFHDRLYCAGCETAHAAELFSLRQRHAGGDNTRIYIAHEGYVRWIDIEGWVAHMHRNNECDIYRVLCSKPCHFLRGKDGSRNDIYKGIRIRIKKVLDNFEVEVF
jgi:hypothetical protein